MTAGIKQGGVYRNVTDKYVKVNGVYRQINLAYTKVGGVYREHFTSEVVAVVTDTGGRFVMQDYFTPSDWSSQKRKRLIINPGVIRADSAWIVAAQHVNDLATWGGSLTLENHGHLIGYGGAPNGGNGGDVLYGNSGRSYGKTVFVDNYNQMFAGGGGGAQGITGEGMYNRNPADPNAWHFATSNTLQSWLISGDGTGTQHQISWSHAPQSYSIFNPLVFTADPSTSRYRDPKTGVTFLRDTSRVWDYNRGYARFRIAIADILPVPGGTGGRGTGWDGAAQVGQPPSAPGAVNVTAGTGYTGADYGQNAVPGGLSGVVSYQSLGWSIRNYPGSDVRGRTV